jgi:hypothetical protein
MRNFRGAIKGHSANFEAAQNKHNNQFIVEYGTVDILSTTQVSSPFQRA